MVECEVCINELEDHYGTAVCAQCRKLACGNCHDTCQECGRIICEACGMTDSWSASAGTLHYCDLCKDL